MSSIEWYKKKLREKLGVPESLPVEVPVPLSPAPHEKPVSTPVPALPPQQVKPAYAPPSSKLWTYLCPTCDKDITFLPEELEQLREIFKSSPAPVLHLTDSHRGPVMKDYPGVKKGQECLHLQPIAVNCVGGIVAEDPGPNPTVTRGYS